MVYVMGYTSVIVFLAMLSVQFLLDFNEYDEVNGQVQPSEFLVVQEKF